MSEELEKLIHDMVNENYKSCTDCPQKHECLCLRCIGGCELAVCPKGASNAVRQCDLFISNNE